MNKVHVNIGPLKKDIISYLDTGYDADKQLCIGILNLIDEHTFKDTPWPCGKSPIAPIIDADTNQAQQEKQFHPLTYDDIKDDPYYYHSPEPEVDDARIKPVGKQKKNQFLDWELKGDLS